MTCANASKVSRDAVSLNLIFTACTCEQNSRHGRAALRSAGCREQATYGAGDKRIRRSNNACQRCWAAAGDIGWLKLTLAGGLEQARIAGKMLVRKTTENYLVDFVGVSREFTHGADRRRRRELDRVAEHTGADRGECYGFK